MRDRYVFDSSTLILLAKATLLRSFAKLHSVRIPPEVTSEVLRKKEAEDANIIRTLMKNGSIKEIRGKTPATKLMYDFVLERGEAEALLLALEGKHILATDDWRAIRACKVLDVRFVTAVHCLIAICKQKGLDKRLALEKLNVLEKYARYSENIIKDARKMIEGDKHG